MFHKYCQQTNRPYNSLHNKLTGKINDTLYICLNTQETDNYNIASQRGLNIILLSLRFN